MDSKRSREKTESKKEYKTETTAGTCISDRGLVNSRFVARVYYEE
jgi:hypothetical protein